MQCNKVSCCLKFVFLTFICVCLILLGRVYLSKNNPVITASVPSISKSEEGKINTDSDISESDLDTRMKEFIMNNPEVIVDSVALMQKRKTQEVEEKQQAILNERVADLEDIKSSPFLGAESGDVTITVFYDYGCGYCKKANSVLNALIASDSGVRVIYKPFGILGDPSLYISKLMLAVYSKDQSKFGKVHEDVMSLKSMTRDDLKSIIESAGLNFDELDITASSADVSNMYHKIIELASALKIHGAPAFVINRQYYSGFMNLRAMQEIIANIRSKGEVSK